MIQKDRNIKPEFYATKLYLTKLAEKYKNRGYDKVFLENEFNYLGDIKEVIRKINEQNDYLDEITNRMSKTIQRLSKLENLDPKVKKILVEDNVFLFSELSNFAENIIKNEDRIIQSIDRFRKIEKVIDAKTKTLTKHGFDTEMHYIYQNLLLKKHKELTVIVFDMNNLKSINESYGHQTGSESILKFGSVLKSEIHASGYKYILSNYFGGDEWFLSLIDVTQQQAIDLVKRFFLTLKNNTYEIKENVLKLSACAGIAHFHPTKNKGNENLTPKILLQIADVLVLKSKVQKNRNKSGNAYKAVNVTNFTLQDVKGMTKEVQTMPKKLNKKTLDKKKLLELFETRKKQNEKIMRARTLGEKKILRYNLDSLNEVIGQKIIESITKALSETKTSIIEKIPTIGKKAIKMAIDEIERNLNNEIISEEKRDTITEKILNSLEFQKYCKNEIFKVYEENIFNLEKKIAKS